MQNGDEKHPAISGFHPDNPHAGPYDFDQLASAFPKLNSHLIEKPDGSGRWIRFSDPTAVRLLNRAILENDYGISDWELPEPYLCPTIPGRIDYLFHLRSLIGKNVPEVTLLDIGTGASGIYALLAASHFKWRVIACDASPPSLQCLRTTLLRNPQIASRIAIRVQADPARILQGVLHNDDQITATVCNPPFYDSPESAARAHHHKHRTHLRRNLPSHPRFRSTGGWIHELCYPEGEVGFVQQLLHESAVHASRVHWFTTLLSRASSVTQLKPMLEKLNPAEVRILPMQHGNKQSRILAWRFNTCS